MSEQTNKKISSIDPNYVKNLAKLQFTKTELKEYANQLKEILQYVDRLSNLSTEKVSPTYQTTGLSNCFQTESKYNLTLQSQEALQNAPHQKNQLYQIKGLSYEK